MGVYLIDYETQLSSVVADEKFEQNIYARGSTGQTLQSEVAFIRLPGGAEWLGFRDVRKVNWTTVKSGGPSIADVLTMSAGDMTKALAIANASAKHNLGLPRTVNVPTAPLDIVHPMHRGRARSTHCAVKRASAAHAPMVVRFAKSRGRRWSASPTAGT